MSKRYLIIVIILLAGGLYAWQESRHEHAHTKDSHSHGGEEAKDGHGHAHGEDDHSEDEGSTVIEPEIADKTGIKIEEAATALIHESIRLTGRTLLNENKTAQVKARFPGIVREVKKTIGDTVTDGDVLAMVESNDSLQVYPVKAPIGGVVITRNTNVGDVAADAPIFTITDISELWAEFHIFPRDIERIKIGQTIFITSFEGDLMAEAKVTTLLPMAEAASQTVVARATIANPSGVWRSGMTVRGDVVVAEHPASVAVKTSAIQRMEGKISVFVQNGERFETRHVTTGASNDTWTEVLKGLQAGERYVSDRSFRVKADIGKAGVAHEH